MNWRFSGFLILTVIFLFTGFVFGYDDLFKPGSYFNPYVVTPEPFGSKWEIKAKYPAFTENPFAPGTYFNPYVIQKSFSGEYEIKPKYPVIEESPFKPGSYFNPYVIKPLPGRRQYEIRPRFPSW